MYLATADQVVDNSGDIAALEPQIDEIWKWLTSLPDLPPDQSPADPARERASN